MADGDPEDLPDELIEDLPEELKERRPDEASVLSPDELDISKSEYVEEIEEGRFVVSPHKRTGLPERPEPQPDDSTDEAPTEPPADEHATPQAEQESPPPQPNQSQPTQPQQRRQSHPHQQPSQQLSQEAVHRWLRQDFQQQSSQYAFDVTATFDGTVSQRRMASNDVVTIFESLMLWYAQQVDSNTPVEEILGILLMESNVPVRYPPESVLSLVKSAGLTPEDSIADLLEAIQDEGVQL